MKLQIIIHTDNAAFDDNPSTEVARILRGIIVELRADRSAFKKIIEESRPLRDINGNTVGHIKAWK